LESVAHDSKSHGVETDADSNRHVSNKLKRFETRVQPWKSGPFRACPELVEGAA
jgi:hypothetical protein